MPTFNTYQQPAAETPLARKWFVRALIASLVIHAVLFETFRATKIEHFSPYTARLVPRNFALGRVAVDETQALDQSDQKETKQTDQKDNTQVLPKIDIPQDSPTADTNPKDVVYTPTAPDVVKPIATENPKIADADLKALTKMQQSISKDLDNDLNKMSEQLIKEKPQTSTKSVLKLSSNTATGGPGSPAAGADAIPGTKSLDEALSSTGGGLQSGDKIGIRGGALFNEDSAELRPDAMNDLKKLATIVKRYPKATFSIEGYADSFGTPEYNLDLSQRRADTVKSWLLLTVGVNPYRVESKGFGSTNYKVPPNGTVDEQEPNRRVEIAITFPH